MSQTLKSRISVIILMALLLTSLVGTMCYATEAETPAETTTETTAKPDVKLNRKVLFTGKTYWNMRGKGSARRTYEDGKIGCGIIGSINKNKEYGIYIIGEGFIKEEQIKSSDKYITIELKKAENGVKSSLSSDGE